MKRVHRDRPDEEVLRTLISSYSPKRCFESDEECAEFKLQACLWMNEILEVEESDCASPSVGDSDLLGSCPLEQSVSHSSHRSSRSFDSGDAHSNYSEDQRSPQAPSRLD